MVTQHHPMPQQPQQSPPRRPTNPAQAKKRRKQSTKPKQQRNLTWVYAIVGALAVGFVITATLIGSLGVLYMAQPRIASDVTVAGVNLGGLPLEDAQAKLQSAVSGQTIRLVDGPRSWTASLSQLGVTSDVERMMMSARSARRGQDIPAAYNLDLSQTQNGFIALAPQINLEAEPGLAGREMEIPVMLDRLRTDLIGEIADGVFELTMIDTEPLRVTAANYTGEPISHTVQAGQELGLIAKEYGVEISDILELNNIDDADFIYPGQTLKIPAPGVYEPSEEEAPAAPTNRGRSIVVSTETQRIYAYEDGKLVRSHLVSTGRSETPTVKGDYKVYVKHVATDMSGPDYYLPDVPYTMYFYQGYGIHGTYWHNSFGRPMSHGCVNLPINEAQWIFDFASVGTPVRVI